MIFTKHFFNESWYIHTMEHWSAFKKMKIWHNMDESLNNYAE